ncbi:MAG: carboxypeptidase-like regulatory domain-containing protein, partial [Terriglobales bacterium]
MVRRTSLVVLLLVALSVVASSQTYLGRILGTVTDASNAIVPKAKVSIINVGTSATRNLDTNEAGEYVAPNLSPGEYRIIVEANGFKKVERTGIRLEVAKDARIDFQLQPGSSVEQVTVTAEAPLIETTNDTLGGTFSNKSINDLPLNGRDFQNLVVLRPGVQRSPGGGFLSISSNGNRPEDNNFIVDGTDNNDPYYGTTVINAEGVQGTPGSILPIDAIQEFNAQENPPAEYG